MKKILIGVLICVMVIGVLAPTAMAVSYDDYRHVDTYINGEKAELARSSLLMNNTTYVPLRAMSVALGATDVSWDDGTATVTAPDLTLIVNTRSDYIIANDRCFYCPGIVKNICGNLVLPVRIFAKFFGAEVEWNSSDKSINVITGTETITYGDNYYNAEDLYWLSRIIHAEARGQSLEGMIAVGTVIMNRVASDEYPDTIYDVIFDFEYGVQFTPAYTGSVYEEPDEQSIMAAKMVLDGAREAGEALFFASTPDCWAAYYRPYITSIGGHDFYA